jgi:hypothetical protein
MSSIKEAAAAIDAVDAAYNAVAALPLHSLTRSDQQAILNRYEKLNKLLMVTERRLLGRLITERQAQPLRGGSPRSGQPPGHRAAR